jgi:Mn-dependent DtxR family transcriptional regulator
VLSCVERGDGVPRILTDIEEKFLEHLTTLKKPVTAKAMAKRFIVSESRARTILKFLHEKGFTEVIEQGSIKLHKFKD